MIAFEVSGDAGPPHGSASMQIMGAAGGAVLLSPLSATPTLVRACVSSELRGTTNELTFRVAASGGGCAAFPAYEMWVDDVLFSDDPTDCIPLASGGP